MPCAHGLLAEDCAVEHWCKLPGSRREPREWRADCPLCHAGRAVVWDVPGRSVRWGRLWCSCDRAKVRQAIAVLLPGCLPTRRAARPSIDHDALVKLALDISLPPMTLRLRLLEMTGMSTTGALDELHVRRENRNRVIAGLSGGVSKRMQNRRS